MLPAPLFSRCHAPRSLFSSPTRSSLLFVENACCARLALVALPVFLNSNSLVVDAGIEKGGHSSPCAPVTSAAAQKKKSLLRKEEEEEEEAIRTAADHLLYSRISSILVLSAMLY